MWKLQDGLDHVRPWTNRSGVDLDKAASALICEELDSANLDWVSVLKSADARKLTEGALAEAKLHSRNTETANCADIILNLEF